MKTTIKTWLSLVLALVMLLSLFPVTAAKFDWQDGVVPEDWEANFVDEHEEVTATNILTPVNPNASQECKNLYAYLCQLTDTQTFLTGQFDLNGDGRAYKWIVDDYGIEPALYSTSYDMHVVEPVWDSEQEGKLLNTPISFADVDAANAMLKKHYDNGNVLLIHADRAYRDIVIDLLIEKGVYPDVMGMIKELDMTNPDRDMQAYALYREHVKHRNAALKKLEDSGVKAYMFREFAEFNIHGFFLSGDSGRHFARVYQQHVQSMIDDGLTGFLSTYTPAARYETLSHNPGNEYVDVYSITLYSPEERRGGFDGNVFKDYEWYMKSGKPIGFSEFSCRMDNYDANIPVAYQSRASWFTTLKDVVSYWPGLTWVNVWGDASYSTYNMDDKAIGNDDGLLFLDSPFTLSLDEIPDYQNTVIRAPGIAQLYSKDDAAGEYHGMEQRAYSAAELKAMGLTLADLRALRLNTGYAITFYSGDNCTGESWSYAVSQEILPATVVAKFKSCEITPVPCISFEKDVWASDNDDQAWKANDGIISMWKGTVSEDGTAWLYIDLGTPHTISRYIVKTAGYAGMVGMYNVRDFQLQYSNDAVHWTTISTVTDNEDSQVSRNLYAVTAQYFRLYITQANSYVGNNPEEKLTATIAEFELYGAEAMVVPEPEPTTTTKKPTTTTTKKVTTTTKKTTKKTTTTTALKLATPKVTVSNATKGVKVSWGKVSKADKYYVYRKTGSGSWSKIKTTTSVSYTDESAKAGKSYQYMVKAVKGSVTSGYKAVSITRLTAPATKVANASKGVKVSWGKVTGASKYYVYRKTGSGSWSKIKTTTSTSYTDTKASAGKSYQYMVKAVKGDYTSYYKAASIRRLKAPSSVKLAKATKGFKVSWSKVTSAKKYEIYRKVGNGSYTKIKTVTTTSYTDKTAKKGKYYTYRVRAVYSSYKSVFKTGSKTKR